MRRLIVLSLPLQLAIPAFTVFQALHNKNFFGKLLLAKISFDNDNLGHTKLENFLGYSISIIRLHKAYTTLENFLCSSNSNQYRLYLVQIIIENFLMCSISTVSLYWVHTQLENFLCCSI
jgi:hypothetical protein